MEFSGQQAKAIEDVLRWHKRKGAPQVYYLAGYAGTGKTTIAREIADQVSGKVLFAAFTGKAAHVMHRKGCTGASTLHSLIYKVEETALGIRFRINHESELAKARLLVVDECSMVGAELGADVLSFGTRVLVIGDPAQLPPVKDAGFFTSAEPNTMLTEIHRQARDNPIIALATTVREGGRIEAGRYGDSIVTDGRPARDAVMKTDQLLVGRNRTRRGANAKYRANLGREQWHPVRGDRLVCLRNNKENGLLNGSLWNAEAVGAAIKGGTTQIEITSADDPHLRIETSCWSNYFEGTEEALAPYEKRKFDAFDFGYALTCHKAQGSQWDDVVVMDESDAFREDAAKWLYTAITRAAVRVTIARSMGDGR